MTLIDVSAQAARYGFELVVEDLGPQSKVWQWQRGSDTNWPRFGTEQEALDWMEHRIRTATLFDR